MSRLSEITKLKQLRKNRVRSTIKGTSDRPRLSIFVSNKNITAQLIDDTSHKTVAYASSLNIKAEKSTNMTDIAAKVGKEIASSAKKHKIKFAVLDRGSKLYHGRVKALTDAAREEGLKI